MPSIMHRIAISAPPEAVQPLLATKKGIAAWWTGRLPDGDDAGGGELSPFFGGDEPAAVMQVVERDGHASVWRCLEGPSEWVGTPISFMLERRPDGGTTLPFRHDGWAAETDFMGGRTTNWGAYLASLEHGVEGRECAPYPAGELSR